MKLWPLAAMAALPWTSCISRSFHSAQVSDGVNRCATPIDVSAYLNAHRRCFGPGVEARRALYPWIPCNKVELLSHAEEVRDNNQDIVSYLGGSAAVFQKGDIAPLFANPDVKDASWEKENPIVSRPIARAVRDLISGAKETLFFDVFLLGGTWGLDISRELLQAAGRGVKVLVLRDTDNKVGVGSEMEPLWDALVEKARSHPNLTVLQSEIHRRPSAIPFGLNKLIEGFDGAGDFPVSLAGKSDHSKTIVADGLTRLPRALVGSKNTVDSAGSFFYDEVLQVIGPSAAATLISYAPDLRLALEREKTLAEGARSDAWAAEWAADLELRRTGGKETLVDAAGASEVLLLENNGDDSVRNVESTILNLVGRAKKSIEIYNFLAYNPALSKALAQAIARGVSVRVLVDSLPKKRGLNEFQWDFMKEGGASDEQIQAALRWRTQLPEVKLRDERPPLAQQQHVKTIIVDGELVLAGSANFDSGTFSGAFRELSLAVRDAKVAAKAAANFAAVFDSDELSQPFSALLPKERSLLDKAKKKAVRDILITEAARIKALQPEKRLNTEECQ